MLKPFFLTRNIEVNFTRFRSLMRIFAVNREDTPYSLQKMKVNFIFRSLIRIFASEK